MMGLYRGGAYTWTIFCVSNKQVRHKQVSHRQGNKHVLSSDYWAYINMGTYFRVGLYFGGAYIWNEVSVSTCGGLIPGGVGAYIRRAYIQRFTVVIVINNSDKQVGLYSGGGLIFGMR
jgi:hypothetical protein